jgi:hypothetical protein
MSMREILVLHRQRWNSGLAICFLLAVFAEPVGAGLHSVAGEGLLVPFVLYDPAYAINTVVYITVPAGIWTDSIPNEQTAPHTSPGDISNPLVSPITLHWTFFDLDGKRLQDGKLQSVPNGITTLNWGTIAPSQIGEPGYLIVQTELGAQGKEADANLFGDAFMSFGYRLADIPVLALADGEDAWPAGANQNEQGPNPVQGNEIVGRFPPSSMSGLPASELHSPFSAGIRVGSADSDQPTITEFDLPFGRRSGKSMTPMGGPWLPSQPTLLVVWNDHNDTQWSHTPVFLFDDSANYCSDSLNLSRQLNIYWISPPVPFGFGPDYLGWKQLCTPSPNALTSPAYILFRLRSAQQRTASTAFSIIFSGEQAETVSARERGRITTP